LINDQHRLLDEGKLGGKHQFHLLEGKGKMNYKERGRSIALVHKQECLNQKNKVNIDESTSTWKNPNNKTCMYHGKNGHVEKPCSKKSDD
jgi:hypothetical protein